MSFTSTASRIQYTASGSSTDFAFPYLFYDASHLKVWITDLNEVSTLQTLNTDYAVSGAGNATGGTVTFGTPPSAGCRITIWRVVPQVQNLDLVNNAGFDADLLEKSLDLQIMALQTLDDTISRAIVVSATSDVSVPDPETYILSLKTIQANAEAAQSDASTSAALALNYKNEAQTASTQCNDVVATMQTALAHPARTDNPHEVTAAQVGAARVADRVLPGSVIAFSGTFGGPDNRNPIPRNSTTPDTGWLLCDGGDDGNGGTVPDLRDRMILGASDTHAAGTTGGAESHTHTVSGTVGATTLTEAQMPYHCHSANRANNIGDYQPYFQGGGTPQGQFLTQYTGGSQAHSHSLAVSSGAASSLPPYYAMAYIMKL